MRPAAGAISTSKAAWPSRPRSRRPRRSRTGWPRCARRPVGLYRRQGRLGHPPGLRGSNRLQRARHGAGPDRRARRAHRPPGPDSQDAAAGRAQLGLPARTDAGRDRGAAAAAPVQRRHGPRADAAGRRHGAGRADAGPDPRATARLALQRLVGTAERQWPLGRAAGNAALRRGALRDGNVIAVRRDGRWQFVDPQGRPLSKQRYGDRVALLAPGAWLVKREHNAPAILLDADLRPMRSFRQDYAPEKREGWTVLRDDEAILLVDPVGRLSILSLPQGRVDIQNGRAWVYARTSDGATDATTDGRRTRRLTPPTPPSTPRRPPPTPRSPSRRPAHGAQAQRQECRAGRGRRRGAGPPAREPDPAPPTPLRSIGCPILPPSRIRRRPWSSCPSPPRTCRARADRHAGRGASRRCRARGGGRGAGSRPAVDAAVAEAAVAEAAADAAAAAADAAIGSANRPETLIQIYAADGQPLLSHTQAARLRDYSVTPVQPDKRLSAREARCCRWRHYRRATTSSPTASSPPTARS